ncbi:MAG: hypothetical protein ACI4HN_09035 [Ruminococcus sp.]
MNNEEFLELIQPQGWSNSACLGYAILACRNLGFTGCEITDFIDMLNSTFGNYSIEEAEKVYLNF